MNILFLGPEVKRLSCFLQELGDNLSYCEDKITLGTRIVDRSEFIISYGYRYIIGQDVIERFPGKIINLHISYLPWNRGADPNLWSLLENSPKGVSIHIIDAGLDTGDLIAQRCVELAQNDTLSTSYLRLRENVEILFMEVWPQLRSGKMKSRPQPFGGSYHKSTDRKKIEHLLAYGWNTPVAELIAGYKKRETGQGEN